jgi:hypothetical protein
MGVDDAHVGDAFECPECGAEVTFRETMAPATLAPSLIRATTLPKAPAPQQLPTSQIEAKPRIRLGQQPTPHENPTRVGLVDGSASPRRNAPKGDRAVAKGLPPSDAPETDIMRVHPSMARTQPFLWLGLVLLASLGLLGAAWMMLRERPVWLVSVPGVLGAGGGVWLLWWWLQTRGSEIRVTSKRLIDSDGLLTRRVTEVLHKDIKKIELRQTLWQRLCGVGELSISADSHDGPEVFMANIPQPQRVREIIDAYRPL